MSAASEREGRRGRNRRSIGLVLTGGGARAAYQVGFLRHIAQKHPEFRFEIVTGVSAGAINASYLASHPGSPREAVEALSELWLGLTPDRVFRVGSFSLARGICRWAMHLLSGGRLRYDTVRGLVDTGPLREYLSGGLLESPDDPALHGIAANLKQKELRAVALSTVDWLTGRTTIWVQGDNLNTWTRPERLAVESELTLDHVLASAALPLLFPAVRLGEGWYGDGGVRLTAPLSPAIHLGCDRLIAISTRYRPPRDQPPRANVEGYPPPAQVAGVLLNAIFLDVLDHDAARLERTNDLLSRIEERERGELRNVDLLVLRPSQDLGRLAGDFELDLPFSFRFLMRGLGSKRTSSPDLLSLLLFERRYIQRLIEIGEQDAENRADEIAALVDRND